MGDKKLVIKERSFKGINKIHLIWSFSNFRSS